MRRQPWIRIGRDRRGLASGLLGFFAIIVISAFLFTLFDPAVSTVLEVSSQNADHTAAANAIDERQTVWSNILFYPLLLGAMFIIARSVFESRRTG